MLYLKNDTIKQRRASLVEAAATGTACLESGGNSMVGHRRAVIRPENSLLIEGQTRRHSPVSFNSVCCRLDHHQPARTLDYIESRIEARLDSSSSEKFSILKALLPQIGKWFRLKSSTSDNTDALGLA